MMSHEVPEGVNGGGRGRKSRNPKCYSCPTCYKGFTTKGNLEFHVNSIHLRVTSYSCDLCPKVFAQAGNLRTHRENVHGKIKRFPCAYCPKAFSQKGALMNHGSNVHPHMQEIPGAHHHHLQHPQGGGGAVRHTFHPPAQIEIVQNPLLMDPNTITQIVQNPSSKSKRKNFVPLQTISEGDLLRQGVQVIQTSVTMETPAPLDLVGAAYNPPPTQTSEKPPKKKKHHCTLCDKSFAQIINLRTHVSTVHEGKKNYPCPECDKNFTQKGNLKAHITTIHQKLKNFQCMYCNKLFSQKGNMKTHIKNTHS